jgi:hypothetical protein
MNAGSAWGIVALGLLLASGEAYPARAAMAPPINFANPGFQNPAPYSPFVHTIPIPQFSARGILTSVIYDADLYASLTTFTNFGQPNPLPPPPPTFNPPAGGIYYNFVFEDYFAGDKLHLGTGEQTIEFIHDGDNPGHLKLHFKFSDPAYLSPFVGNGTVDFDGLSSVVTNDGAPPPDLALQINATGSITYIYTPIPEPPSVLLFGMAGFALAALRLRGRSRRRAVSAR